ncbi:MAG TPA: ABC transporter ATP-binding protein [Candidatus Limnocylindrales bacterium]
MTLVLAGLGYRYAGAPKQALEGIDLVLEPGRVVGVAGRSESGKSTLCLVASGLAPASIGGEISGTRQLDGVDASALRPDEFAQRCGILFQNPLTQLSGTAVTVFEEIAFGPRNLGLEVADIVERVESTAAMLGIDPLLDRDPGRLSGGQAQLVALASVLALRPGHLILDEPTSQLDPFGTRLVAENLVALARHGGTAILIVEHKPELLATLADELVVLDGGTIVLAGPTRDVLASPDLGRHGVEPPAAVRIERAVAARGGTVDARVLVAAAGDASVPKPRRFPDERAS